MSDEWSESEKEVRKQVHELREWWSSSAEEAFADAAVTLAGHYMHSIEGAVEFVRDLLTAAGSEYGD